MAPKKVQMPDNIYGDDQPGAIAKLTGGGSPRSTAMPPQPKPKETPPPPPDVVPKRPVQNRELKQTSFYLSLEDLAKLEDMAYTHFKRTGKRINRNDIIRHLLRKSQLHDIADLET